jgi:hypothetical protein
LIAKPGEKVNTSEPSYEPSARRDAAAAGELVNFNAGSDSGLGKARSRINPIPCLPRAAEETFGVAPKAFISYRREDIAGHA